MDTQITLECAKDIIHTLKYMVSKCDDDHVLEVAQLITSIRDACKYLCVESIRSLKVVLCVRMRFMCYVCFGKKKTIHVTSQFSNTQRNLPRNLAIFAPDKLKILNCACKYQE